MKGIRKRAELFSLLLVFWLPLKSGAGACDGWKTRCSDIQELRRNRANTFEYGENEFSCNCDVPRKGTVQLQAEAKRKIGPTRNFKAGEFAKCLSKAFDTLKSAQKNDLGVILSELKALSIDGLSVADIKKTFLDKSSPYNQLRERIRNDPGPYFWYRDYALEGPFQNLDESLTGLRSISTPDIIVKKYDQSVLDIVGKINDPKKILELVVKTAQQSDSPISPNTSRTAFTPMIAKLMLFETIRAHHAANPKKIKQIMERLKLKFDYKDPQAKQIDNPDSVTIHNGYYLGVDPEHFLDHPNHGASAGYDCTAIIQKCQAMAGIEFPTGFKLLSTRLAAMGNPEKEKQWPDIEDLKGFYGHEKFECEEQLSPGDVVAFPGHAFVFLGYEPDEHGRMQMMTYEAIAGEYRSYGKFARELYGPNACDPARFSSGGANQANIIKVLQ